MKKHTINFLIFIVLLSFLTACDKDDNPSSGKGNSVVTLSEKGTVFLKAYLPDTEPSEISKSEDNQTYKASFRNDSLYIIFDKDGNWIRAKAVDILPTSLLSCLPVPMKDAAQKFHKNDTIKSIEVKEYGYMYGLPKTALGYDTKGTYLGYDELQADVLSIVSKEFIDKYCKGANVSSVLFNAEKYSKRYYLVYLTNQFVIRFDYTTGNWQKVDGGTQALSDELLALIPQSVLDFLDKSEDKIVSMEIEQKGLYSFKYLSGNGHTVITEDYEGDEVSSSDVYKAFRAFVDEHWSADVNIIRTVWSSVDPQIYHYSLDNGFQLEFTTTKNWKRIVAGDTQLSIPTSILNTLPVSVVSYLNESYKSYAVILLEKTNEGYTLLLSDNVELFFDKSGKLLKEVKA